MQLDYVVKRGGIFLLIVWLAATLNLFLPSVSGRDPVREKLLQQAQLGGYVQAGIEAMTKGTSSGLASTSHCGASTWPISTTCPGCISTIPLPTIHGRSNQIMAEAIPWTIGLLGTTTILSFTIGTLLGALLAWPGAPGACAFSCRHCWALHAIPFFLCGLILMYLLAFQLNGCPCSAATRPVPFPP